MKTIIVEYERPPLRAIYRTAFEDNGESDEEVVADMKRSHPNVRVRQIIRKGEEEKDENN